jgi:hypothetical protein
MLKLKPCCHMLRCRFGFAVLFDIHGQEHRPCLELGYGVTTDQLAAGDNVISTLQPGVCNGLMHLQRFYCAPSRSQLALCEFLFAW